MELQNRGLNNTHWTEEEKKTKTEKKSNYPTNTKLIHIFQIVDNEINKNTKKKYLKTKKYKSIL